MRTAFLALALAVATGAAERGIKPRPSTGDYPVLEARDALVLAGAMLSQDEARASFASDVHRNYIVFEVAVYPKGTVEIGREDFLLRLPGSQTTIRPVDAKTIAGVLQKTAPSDREITLYPSAGVGYESGPWRSGTTKSVGMGVGIGSSKPASTDADRKTMELELSEKGLPEGRIDKPVAGYLYFPAPSKRKATTYQLEYAAQGGKLVLEFYDKTRP